MDTKAGSINTKEFESAEYAVFIKSTEKMFNGFKCAPGELSRKFRGKKLITAEVYDCISDKTVTVACSLSWMINDLKYQIKMDSNNYYTIVKLIKTVTSLEPLGSYLEEQVKITKETMKKRQNQGLVETKYDPYKSDFSEVTRYSVSNNQYRDLPCPIPKSTDDLTSTTEAKNITQRQITPSFSVDSFRSISDGR